MGRKSGGMIGTVDMIIELGLMPFFFKFLFHLPHNLKTSSDKSFSFLKMRRF